MPSNQRTYTPATIEAIWALLCEGVAPSEIRRRLAADECELGYSVPMPKRTLFDHIRRLKAQRGDPLRQDGPVREGQEVSTAEAIRRRGLELLQRELAKVEARQEAGKPLSTADIARVDKVVRAADDIKRRATEPDRKRTPAQNAKGVERQGGATSTLLGELARESVKAPDAPPA